MLERHSGDADTPAHPRRVQRADARTGCRSSCSPTSPTATASTSSASLKESAFDPLSRTCDFMLKEEAHHMFVGATGVGRVVERTVELMKRARHRRRRARTAASTSTMIQRYLNFHYSVSLDLFGAETSTNAANYFAAGLKGRFQEERRDDDHRAHRATPRTSTPVARRRRSTTDEVAGAARRSTRPARRLRRRLPEGRRPLEPHAGAGRRRPRLHAAARRVQPARRRCSPATTSRPTGDVVSAERRGQAQRRPLAADRRRTRRTCASLMRPVYEPGKIAGWVAPPRDGHQRQAVRLRVRALPLSAAVSAARCRPPVLMAGRADRPSTCGGEQMTNLTAVGSGRCRQRRDPGSCTRDRASGPPPGTPAGSTRVSSVSSSTAS